MRAQELFRIVYTEPSLMTPAAHASIRQLLESRLFSDAILSPEGKREGQYCGEAVELPSMQVSNGIAHIPIGGAIGQKLSGFAKYSGAVDVSDISDEIDLAVQNSQVHTVLFDIDSPGGMVSGTPELADKIAAIRKPKYAFTNGMMASAAYWVGAATDGIFATKTSQVGSIGVYMVTYDETKAYEAQGVKVELIKAGALKGLGYPGTALSEEGRSHLQSRINDIWSMFKGHVLESRGNHISEDTMQGQTFLADEAMKRGLIDFVVKSKGEMLNLLMQS